MQPKAKRFKEAYKAFLEDDMRIFGRIVRVFQPRTLLEFVVYMYDNGIEPKKTVDAIRLSFKNIGTSK